MTTSDPRADQHDDNPREHRGLGQRILDAVLGDPAEQRDDRAADTAGTATASTAERRAADAPEGYAVDRTRGEQTSYEQVMRDSPRSDAVQADRDAGYDPSVATDDARRDTGYGSTGSTATDARRDAGYDPSVATDDARRDAGYDDPVARAAGHDSPDPGRDPLAGDAPRDLAPAGYEDRRPADRTTGYGAAAATGTGVAGRGGAGQDFVTESYDPDRDTGYDPQSAGTAMDAPADQDSRAAVGHAGAVDTGRADDRRHGAGDYDPARDTAYVDAARAEADRTTGRRDDDYDTGRVDADRADRAVTDPGDRDRDDTHRGARAAAAAGAVGLAGAAAAVFAGRDHDRSERDTRSADTRFSEVDDTVTVDATGTGRGTPDTGATTGTGGVARGVADEDGASRPRERLVPTERAEEYSSRWDALKGDFVDEPRRAVRQADELVGEVLDELQRLFADQRRGLEQSFDHDQASTEDLRLALRRYRSFFDRLLSF